jgi:DNA-binding CsgD family transcriptional regulator
MSRKTPQYVKLKVARRRKKILELMRKNPDYTYAELAEVIGVSRMTIANDMRKINEEVNMQTVEDFMIHRQRVLTEIWEKKNLCMDRLNKLKPHQGARWMEEYSKLLDKEIRVLGLYAPEKMMIKHSQEASKEQRDAAVNAALGVVTENPTVIDLVQKQIPEKTEEKKDDDSDSEDDVSKSFFSIA